MDKAPALLIFETSVKPENEQEFNQWYETEHLPERLACPGFISGRRFKVEGEPGRYIAVYELTSAAVLESAEYKKLAQPSAWTQRITTMLFNSSRKVCVPIASQPDLQDSRSRYNKI